MKLQYDFYSVWIFIGIISFLGFCLENVWLFITKGYIDNRNMTLPFLLGYGLTLETFYIVIGTPENPHFPLFPETEKSVVQKYLLYFFVSFLAVCIGEIILGFSVEKLCKFAYWDYSKLPLHITKYTSIPTSIGFAFLITFFMGKCFPSIMRFICHIPPHWSKKIAIVLIVLMVCDFIYSFYWMYRYKRLNLRWKKIFFRGILADEQHVYISHQ